MATTEGGAAVSTAHSGEGRLPAGEEKRRQVRAMFDTIAPRYDMVNRIMTLRLDVRWRRITIDRLGLPAGSTVVDVACGTGDLCIDLNRRDLRAIGVDMSHGMLVAARTNAPLVEGDALAMPFPDARIDGATCGFALRNFVALDPFISELARIVRKGGRIALLDVSTPSNRLMRLGHQIYFGRVVPLIGGLLSDRSAYRYLPKSVAYMPPTAALIDMIAAAGFTAVEHRQLSGGISQLVTATRS